MNENLETLKKNELFDLDYSKSFALIHKPPGITSFDCIRILKRHWNTKNLGHGGTLDKFAEGLLPVFINEGLKFSRFFLESYPTLPTYWKTYVAVMEFGKQTATGDPEGNVINISNIPTISNQVIKNLELEFTNKTYIQQAPIYSAKKINGKRMSDLIRNDEKVEPKSTQVTIESLKILNWNSPFLSFEVKCSKGTYIRSLALDIAKHLNSTGYLTSLKRTQVGNFTIQNAISLENAIKGNPNNVTLSLQSLFADFPKIECNEAEKTEIQNGRLNMFFNDLMKRRLYSSPYAITHKGSLIALIQLHENTAIFLRGFPQN